MRGVVQLIDSRAGITRDDAMMIEYMNGVNMPYIIVITKIDKLNKTDRAKALAKLSEMVDGVDIIPYSSLTGEGKSEVLNRIALAISE